MTTIQIIDMARDIIKSPLDASRTFPDDSSSFFKDSVLLNFLNRAQQEVQNRLVQTFENWFVTSTNISLSAGTESYDMPSGCLKILRMENIENSSNPIEIIPVSFNDKERFSNNMTTGITAISISLHYAIAGEKILLKPTTTRSVTNAIRIYYIKRLDDLSTGSSVSELPIEYHEILVWAILKKMAIMQESNPEFLSLVIGEYNRLLAEMTVTAEDRQVQRPRFVKKNRGR